MAKWDYFTFESENGKVKQVMTKDHVMPEGKILPLDKQQWEEDYLADLGRRDWELVSVVPTHNGRKFYLRHLARKQTDDE